MTRRRTAWSTLSLLGITLAAACIRGEGNPGGARALASHRLTGEPEPRLIAIERDVPIREYFEYMDTLLADAEARVPFPVDEHLLVRANPWLIERLMDTDYYRMMERGEFSPDPQALLALRAGDTLALPTVAQADSLRAVMAATVIDVNIPEFRLRILESDRERFSFPVRIGQDRTRYLEMAGREVDLRTLPGSGRIVRIEKSPVFRNPVDNHRYDVTRRDDGQVTGLPRIPWLEPELDGRRMGQLIHPTTNLETLGKAYSNGCIGVSEAAMWRIYYHAPLGTRVVVRYDLEVPGPDGPRRLPDIYGWGGSVPADAPAGGCL
ncbi:MAG: L,D-transpeptidase [Gemmatimonadota bacterium]